MQTLFNPPTRLPTVVVVDGNVKTPAGVDLTLLPGAGGITIIGDAGSPGNLGTPTNDDLFVSGRCEIDNYLYVDNGVFVAYNRTIQLGGSTDLQIIYSTAQTPYAGILGVSTASRNLLICESADRATDFGHAQQTNPTVFIHSADATDTSQWIALWHDQTSGRIESGKGQVAFSSRVKFEADVVHDRHYFADNFLWASGIYGTVWDLTNVVGAGTNVLAPGAGLGGTTLLTTGALTDDYECTQTHDVYFSRVIQPTVEAKISLSTDLVGKEVFFGLSDTPMGAGTDYCMFMFDYSNDNVNWWHSSGGGTDASLAVGPTAGVKQKLRITLDSAGQALFYVDNTLVATVTGAVANDHGDMYLFYGVKTEADQAEIIEGNILTAQWD
jgi:hypothetical protein